MSAAIYDRAAAFFGLACIVHCGAVPLAAIALPFAGAIAETEWVHWVLTGLALAASGVVIASAADARKPAFLVPATMGLALITFGVFSESFGLGETLPTVLGGGLLAIAHIFRLYKND